MSKLKFNIVNKLLNIDNIDRKYLIYCDTDSLFLVLPLYLERNFNETNEKINLIQDKINNDILSDFMAKHNIKIREKEDAPLLAQKFKNEYMIKIMVLYSKKRYISITVNFDKDNNVYYDKDIKGVEGKKETYKFIKSLVDDLISHLKSIRHKSEIYDRFKILEYVIYKYYRKLIEYNKSTLDKINFGMPVNINKNIKDLKTVTGFYRGCVVFNAIMDNYWKGTGKAVWFRVKLNDISYTNKIMNNFKKYKNIKIMKPDKMIKDITIPDDLLFEDSNTLSYIFQIFDIDIDEYVKILLRKTMLLYKPFDVKFMTNLDKRYNKTINANYFLVGDNNIYMN